MEGRFGGPLLIRGQRTRPVAVAGQPLDLDGDIEARMRAADRRVERRDLQVPRRRGRSRARRRLRSRRHGSGAAPKLQIRDRLVRETGQPGSSMVIQSIWMSRCRSCLWACRRATPLMDHHALGRVGLRRGRADVGSDRTAQVVDVGGHDVIEADEAGPCATGSGQPRDRGDALRGRVVRGRTTFWMAGAFVHGRLLRRFRLLRPVNDDRSGAPWRAPLPPIRG